MHAVGAGLAGSAAIFGHGPDDSDVVLVAEDILQWMTKLQRKVGVIPRFLFF